MKRSGTYPAPFGLDTQAAIESPVFLESVLISGLLSGVLVGLLALNLRHRRLRKQNFIQPIQTDYNVW